ncbi:glycosyl transferase family 2 [Desulfonatronospira thiodismutans ASO3-1]|uniref:Glycosyl transferase family 2 n=1 Tax=Desulfonatronospira thiodismutans ASO3-1 TaxID=555779 RepID=D6SU52_9BACT|nr:glycosyltransferase [Desulfonatronospira thiodismutans]EFI32832.1 glycosyl transferase family 2 [Desulfonatronospira thiodismutans ASO3-1]
MSTNHTPATTWQNHLARLPYARDLMPTWQYTFVDPDYEQALNLYLSSRDETLPLDQRYEMLLQSKDLLYSLQQDKKYDISDSMLLVRVLTDLGERSQAALSAKKILERLRQEASIQLQEPFLPPLDSLEQLSMHQAPGTWLQSAVAEALARLEHPTGYHQDIHSDSLQDQVNNLQSYTLEMQRRIALSAQRAGHDMSIAPDSPLVSEGHLNHSIWKKLSGNQSLVSSPTNFISLLDYQGKTGQSLAYDTRMLARSREFKEKGRLKEASKQCFKVIKNDPTNKEAHNEFAVISSKMGDHENAYKFAGFAAADSSNPKYFRTLAAAARKLGQKDEEKMNFMKAETLEQFKAAAQEEVNKAKQIKNPDHGMDLTQIISQCERGMQKPGWDVLAFYTLSHALMASGQTKKDDRLQPLDTALKNKEWLHKRPLYHYWFDRVEFVNNQDKPEISIVMISYRPHEHTPVCLQKLREQTGDRAEIIFVNNGCPDKDFQNVHPYINTYVRLKGNAGASLPRNMGAVFADAPILLFIEDDGIAHEDLVKSHLEIYNNYKAVTVRGTYQTIQGPTPGYYYLGDKVMPSMSNLEGNSSLLTDPFFKIDGWSDYMFYGSEGRELGLRLLKAGYSYDLHLYTPKAILYHDWQRENEHMSTRKMKFFASWSLLHAMHPDEFSNFQDNWTRIMLGMIKVKPVSVCKTSAFDNKPDIEKVLEQTVKSMQKKNWAEAAQHLLSLDNNENSNVNPEENYSAKNPEYLQQGQKAWKQTQNKNQEKIISSQENGQFDHIEVKQTDFNNPLITKKTYNNIIYNNGEIDFNALNINHNIALKQLQKKSSIKVAFLLQMESMWKCDGIYKLMEKDSYFESFIFVCPYFNSSKRTQKERFYDIINNMNKTYEALKKKNFAVINSFNTKENKWIDLKKDIDPDIIFFNRPWESTNKEYTIHNFTDKLTCYVPYNFVSIDNEEQYDQATHNLTWRFFLETQAHQEIIKNNSKANGANTIVSGYPPLDVFFDKSYSPSNPWKMRKDNVKKIIFALHLTTDPEYFFEISDYIFKLARKYNNDIQIAFKPHPILKIRLIKNAPNEENKILKYFKKFESFTNTQVLEGEYKDLFLTSDGLIHNCGSFITEYACTGKPALYLKKDSYILKHKLNEVTEKIMQTCFLANNHYEIDNFINNVIINCNDNLEQKRLEVINKYLIPPNNRTASENIYWHLKNSLS